MRRLEDKWRQELVVVGVHAAKFPSERESANVLQAVRRHRISHAVVNDWSLAIWGEFAVRAWPTTALIDAEGYVVAVESGEIPFETLDMVVSGLVERAERRGVLRRSPPPPTVQDAGRAGLAFPGKVLARGARVWVADTNHDRIVVVDAASGQVQRVIGGGEPGFTDGSAEAARFHGPQGMWLDADVLYVADTGNHAIRAVTAEGEVFTIAGTGAQASSFHDGGMALSVELNSPWDLVARGSSLYLAMAGFHQIWRLDLHGGRIAPIAGTGREGLRDGPADESFLAQPSGLSLHEDTLWIADAETSSVRALDLHSGRMRTAVGQGLFDFGDLDGPADRARLQHALAVAATADGVYVADTFNHRIKRLACGRITSWLGDGVSGLRDGDSPRFYEPSGLSLDGELLYIADTNNHAIRVADTRTGEVRTLELQGLR